MRWTCQAECGGPLWWPLSGSDHWYRPDTDPSVLAADYRRAHPHDGPLVLRWWRDWARPEREVRVEPAREPEPAGAG